MLFCTQSGPVAWAPKGQTAPVHLHFSLWCWDPAPWSMSLPTHLGSCTEGLSRSGQARAPGLPPEPLHTLNAPGPGGQLCLDPEPRRVELGMRNCFPRDFGNSKIRHLWGPGCGFLGKELLAGGVPGNHLLGSNFCTSDCRLMGPTWTMPEEHCQGQPSGVPCIRASGEQDLFSAVLQAAQLWPQVALGLRLA